MGRLDGKAAVVTGAGRKEGLGRGIAARLAAEGAKVVVSDLGTPRAHMGAGDIGTGEEMEAVAAGIRADGGTAMAVACDVTDEEQVQALTARTVDAHGRLDILVNNAGIGYIMKPLTEVTRDEWLAVLGVNLMGAFLATKHAAKQMIAQGDGGRIVNIASQAAKSGFPHMAPYTASKHGMVGLTRSNAVELGAHKITVNAVCPNHVTTGLGAKQNAYFSRFFGQTVQEYLAAMKARNPLGRAGLVEDTANAVAWLCSDEAAYITGEALNVSGGEEMH